MSTKNALALKWLVYALCALALLFFRSLLLGSMLFWGVTPFLPPLLLACIASLEESRSATIFGLCFGVFCDLTIHAPFPCLYTIAFTLAALFAALLSKSFLQQSFLRALVASLLTFAVVDFLNILALAIRAHAALGAMLFLSLREALVSCVLLLVCYPVFFSIRRLFTR